MTTHERLGPALLRRWAVLARSSLAAHRESIDGLNVFPVPDADTGTNMFLTLDAAVEATLDVDHESAPAPDAAGHDPGEDLDRFARAALLGARGNSGVIISQLVRGLVEGLRTAPDGADAGATAQAFENAARAAYAAIDDPAEGTILTVANEAAQAARTAADGGGDLSAVVDAACRGARAALAATTDQLGALHDAGVVDAGGAGLVVVLEALRRVVLGEAEPIAAVEPRPGAAVAQCADAHYTGPRYEVMWVVDDAAEADVADARRRLAQIGDSVLLVGSGVAGGDGRSGPWRGHVHSDDPDAVLALAAALGPARDVTIQDLHAQAEERAQAPRGQAPAGSLVVVAPASGPLLRDVLRRAGATSPDRREGLGAVDEELARHAGAPLAVLPGDAALLAECEQALAGWRADGLDVTVLPATTDAHVLAALAVHEPNAPADAARAALVEGVAAVTAVVLGEGSASDDGLEALRSMAATLAENGDEAGLVTIVAGAGHSAGTLADAVTTAMPGVEVTALDGGDPGYALTIGVER